MDRNDQIKWILGAAEHDGDRIVLISKEEGVKPKNMYAGLGNRSGLHSYIPIAISERWNKSGKNLTKKVNALPPGSIVEVHSFRNIDRNRGRWVRIKQFTLVGQPEFPPINLKDIPSDIQDCFNEYGFDEEKCKLEWAIATRSAEEWFAILLQDPESKELFAVDFSDRAPDHEHDHWHWEVQNDYIGPFDTIDEFTKGELTSSFW